MTKKEIMYNFIDEGIPFEFDGETIVVYGPQAWEDYQMPLDHNGAHATGYERWEPAASGDYVWVPIYEDEL